MAAGAVWGRASDRMSGMCYAGDMPVPGTVVKYSYSYVMKDIGWLVESFTEPGVLGTGQVCLHFVGIGTLHIHPSTPSSSYPHNSKPASPRFPGMY
jgi:hypothetical protein